MLTNSAVPFRKAEVETHKYPGRHRKAESHAQIIFQKLLFPPESKCGWKRERERGTETSGLKSICRLQILKLSEKTEDVPEARHKLGGGDLTIVLSPSLPTHSSPSLLSPLYASYERTTKPLHGPAARFLQPTPTVDENVLVYEQRQIRSTTPDRAA